jgi:hypothetical protein
MTAPNPDMPPSDPQSDPSSPEGRARGGKLGQWLRSLLHAGLVLVMDMRFVTDPRSHEGAAGEVDRVCANHRLAWDLVTRAIRWARALQARLAAEARAERTGLSPEAAGLEQAARLLARPDWYGPAKKRKRVEGAAMRPRADDCIAGMAVAEVVGQICADLSTAATLLGKSRALRIIVAITEAARAMLGGPAAVWEGRPMGPVPDGAAGAAIGPGGGMGLRAPDTG